MNQQKPRIFLDLRKDLPRKFLFRFDGVLLILREPSVQQVEEVMVLGGLDYPLASEFLKFIDWNDETLEEILEFCYALPIGLLSTLINCCKQAFDRPDKVDMELLEDCQPVGKGYVFDLTSKAHLYYDTKHSQKVADYVLERLGVIVKPSPRGGRKSEDRPTEGWLPLTALQDPKAYNDLRRSLQYDPESFENDQEAEFKERMRVLGETEDISDFHGLDKPKKKPRVVQTLNGDKGISLLYEVGKKQFTDMFFSNENAVGFCKAVDEGVDLPTYTKSVLSRVNPELIKSRKKEPLEEVKPLVEEEPEVVKISGRWKGKKKDPKLG